MRSKLGYIVMFAAFLAFGCVKKTIPPPPVNTPAVRTATPKDSLYYEKIYLTFTAGNTPVNYAGISSYGGFSANAGTGYYRSYWYNAYDIFSHGYVRLMKSGFLKPYDAPDDSVDWKPFLATGDYSFAICNGSGVSSQVICPGFFLTYKDVNDTVWYTSVNGSGDQQNSHFTITESKYYYEPPSSPLTYSFEQIKFRGTFDCILYSASGNSLIVTNGKFLQQMSWGN